MGVLTVQYAREYDSMNPSSDMYKIKFEACKMETHLKHIGSIRKNSSNIIE